MSYPSSSAIATIGSRRRTSSTTAKPSTSHGMTAGHQATNGLQERRESYGAASGLPQAQGFGQPLRPIPATPERTEMPLSQSPSPVKGGGWHSPGLTAPQRSSRKHSRSPSRRRAHFETSANGIKWESAKARTVHVKGYAVQARLDQGFFRRNFLRLSSSLPRFYPLQEKEYEEKEKLGRGRIPSSALGNVRNFTVVLSRQIWRLRKRLMILLCFALLYILFYITRRSYATSHR